MNRLPSKRPSQASASRSIGYVTAVALAGLTALLATPLRERLALADIVPLFLIGVVVSAVVWGRGPGVLASIASVLCFDFFFVPPRFSLTVDESGSLVTFMVMLGVSLILSHLSGALRDKAQEAQLRADEASLLHTLAREMSAATNLQDIEQRLNVVLERDIGVNARLLLPDAQQQLHGLRDSAQDLGALEKLIAKGVWASGHALHANPDLRDDALTLLLPLSAGADSRGVLALHEPKAGAVRELPDTLCEALAALVFIAVERVAPRNSMG